MSRYRLLLIGDGSSSEDYSDIMSEKTEMKTGIFRLRTNDLLNTHGFFLLWDRIKI
jgi:hypothetical protein